MTAYMQLGHYEYGPAPKFGLQLLFSGDSRYAQILQQAFPSPARWYGPYESFNPAYDWALYGDNVDPVALGSFLEFASANLLIPTVLDECWALSLHMAAGGRTAIGDLVYRAKSYSEKPGDSQAAEDLCAVLSGQIVKHPTIRRVHGVVGVPANPPKSPHNLPELMAARVSGSLRVPLMKGLITKLKPTDIKNAENQDKLVALDGAYRVEDDVSGRNILLVDDLIRSGSTLAFIAGLLRDKGANLVLGLAATKTVRD